MSSAECEFNQIAIHYLCFRIQNYTIEPITSNITEITAFPTLKSKKQLKRFYHRLIPNYPKLIDSIIKFSSPKVSFHWSGDHDKFFTQVPKIFFSKPFLSLPDWFKSFSHTIDASRIPIADVFLQQRYVDLLPLSNFSKSLSPSNKRYSALKFELVAIVKSINAFKFFLYTIDISLV